MRETFICSHCGGEHPMENHIIFNGQDLCQVCYESETIACERCGEPIFYGQGSRYPGVELEIDGGGETSEKASQILRVGNDLLEHIYIKHDGSLDEGLEIVTHPMTLDYHRDEMPWQEIIQKALSLGYTSHQTGTCGLHVHVNRASLGGFAEEQEETVARLLFLVEHFWLELLRFRRRTQQQMDQWAARAGRTITWTFSAAPSTEYGNRIAAYTEGDT